MSRVADYQAVVRRMNMLIEMAINEPTGPQLTDVLCTTVPSDGADEGYEWLGSVPGMREWVGPRKFKQLLAYEYAIKNKLFESSIELEKTRVDDDRIGMLNIMARRLVSKARLHPNKVLANLINTAEATLGYDGQYFYDTDHESGSSGVQSNLATQDITDPTAPTPEQFRDAVDAMVEEMLGFKDDNGDEFIDGIVEVPNDWTITIPRKYLRIASKAYGQELTAEDVGGTIVATTRHELVRPRIVPLQKMTGNVIDLHYTGDEIKPFVFQDREGLTFDDKGADDIEFKELKWMTKSRFNCGFLAWFFSYRWKFI
ncbi:MAG: Mu-like prophage major head subunit gpT family protein [Planctomycetota bacterium]